MIGSAAAWGATSALSWGLSDFLARFAGRSVGVIAATFSTMVIGSGLLTLYIWLSGEPINWDLSGLGWLIATGIGIALATVLLYDALTKGPVSLASPIVASYPVVTVPISVALGARPSLTHWAAMAATIAGVWLVARAVSARSDQENSEYEPRVIRRAILFAVGSALAFGLSWTSADQAIEIYGPWQTIVAARFVGVLCFGAWLLAKPRTARYPRRAWPILVVLGVFDTMGYLGVFLGLSLANGEFAVVASSSYTVVTVMLARLYLREQVSTVQWLGIALVVGGIAALAAFG